LTNENYRENKYLFRSSILKIFYGQPIIEINVTNGKKNKCQLLTSTLEQRMSHLYHIYILLSNRDLIQRTQESDNRTGSNVMIFLLSRQSIAILSKKIVHQFSRQTDISIRSKSLPMN